MSEEGSATAAKRALRRRLRAERRARDPQDLARASAAIARAAAGVPWLAETRCLAGYVASDGEPDVGAILAAARRRGAVTLLPRLRPDGDLDLVVCADLGADALVRSANGVLEPSGRAVEPSDLAGPAVLLAPAVALDGCGGRLGRGGGGYDRLLARLRPRAWRIIGVCVEAQVLDRLPTQAHDQPVDALLTEAGFRLVESPRG